MDKKDASVYEGKNFNKDVWQVLSKIKELLSYTKNLSINYGDYFNVISSDSTDKISSNAEMHILKRLQDMGALRIESYEWTWDDYGHLQMISMPGAKMAVAKLTHPIPSFSSLEINRDEFEAIYKKYTDVNLGEVESFSGSIQVGEKPSTVVDKSIGIGYLLFHGERIEIGGLGTGRFRLVEILCDHFGRAKTVDVVFDCVKTSKDKNKLDSSLGSGYMGHARKLVIINNQMKEVNRAITNHMKLNSSKGSKFRLRLKSDLKTNNKAVWLEERLVGRRGKQ